MSLSGLDGLANVLTDISTQLITALGQPISIYRDIDGPYDPSTGETGAPMRVSYTAYGAPEDYNDRDIDGTIIERGDRKVTIYKTTQLPMVGDILIMNEQEHRVINVMRIPCQGQDIVYQMQVRA